MRVLMLSWEYPPRIVGGLARHVAGLSEALAGKGVETHVVTTEFPFAPQEEELNGVYIHRVPVEIPAPNFHAWVMLMNHFFTKYTASLPGSFDVIHVHDWLTATAGVELKHLRKTPLVATLHSLEFRRSGISSPESRMVDSIEWWSMYESPTTIVCSGAMKRDIVNHFNSPEAKIWVLPNGITPSNYEARVDRGAVRGRYGVQGDGEMILYVGRLTPQKGVEYLIRAMPQILSKHNARLIVVGDGWIRGDLQKEVEAARVKDRVLFTGFLPDGEVIQLLKSADVLAVPSVYEPFGVIALEGMASGVPVVASNVDGLAEFIRNEDNGILTHPRDAGSIAWGVSRILSDPSTAKNIARRAYDEVRKRFSWDSVAAFTIEAYKQAQHLEGARQT